MFFRVRQYRLSVLVFVVTAATLAVTGIAVVAADSGEQVVHGPARDAPAPLPEIPPPSEITPVTEPNRIGTISDADRAACASDQPPEGLPPGVKGRADDLFCDVVRAESEGLIEEGQELSNEELEGVREAVSEDTSAGDGQ